MVAAAKIALDVNVPLTGRVKYVDLYPEKQNPKDPAKLMPAQWALNGTWEWTTLEGERVQAEGKVYIDTYHLPTSPVQLGLVQQNGTWDDGQPRYKWTYSGAVRVLKTEQGKKRMVTITRLDGATVSPAVAGAAPTPPAVGQASAAPMAPLPTPAPAPPTAPDGDPWAEIARQYERARIVACQVWGEDYNPAALVAATATVFIEGNRRGIA